MAITKLSKELKKLRIDHDINRAQMAKDLKISDGVLESIELGRIEATNDLLDKVATTYADNPEQADALYLVLTQARVESIALVKFDMTALSVDQKTRVVELKDSIAFENAAATEAAAQAAKKAKIAKAAAKQQAKVTQNPETGTVSVAAPASIELSDSDVLAA